MRRALAWATRPTVSASHLPPAPPPLDRQLGTCYLEEAIILTHQVRIQEWRSQKIHPIFDREQELLRPMQCSTCCTGCYSRGWVFPAAHAPGQVKDAHCFSVFDILDDEAASHARRDKTGRRTSAHQREELQTHTHAFLHARYPRCTHAYKRYFVALF